MKLWRSFSVDHTSDYKIVATFSNVENSSLAVDVFNQLVNTSNKTPAPNAKFSQEVYEILSRFKIEALSKSDAIDIGPFKPILNKGNIVEIETDEYNIQPLIKILLHFGGKLEIAKKAKI